MKKGNIRETTIQFDNVVKHGVFICAALFSALFLSGCDLAEPKKRPSDDQSSEARPVATAVAPPVKEAVANDAVDSSIKLDRTFEDREYGFRFDYPSSCVLEKGEGLIGSGNLSLWFSPQQKLDSKAVLMTVKWMYEEKQFSRDSKSEVTRFIKEKGGTLKAFEKVNLGGKPATFIKVAFGGMMDPMGSRVGEQYLLTVENGSDLLINFSGPAKEFENYRSKFNAVLKSFQFDLETETAESE